VVGVRVVGVWVVGVWQLSASHHSTSSGIAIDDDTLEVFDELVKHFFDYR
jgi:hypothetical protein